MAAEASEETATARIFSRHIEGRNHLKSPSHMSVSFQAPHPPLKKKKINWKLTDRGAREMQTAGVNLP